MYKKLFFILFSFILFKCKNDNVVEIYECDRVEYYDFYTKKIILINKDEFCDYKKEWQPFKFRAQGFYFFYKKNKMVYDSIRVGKDIFGPVDGYYYIKKSRSAKSE